MSIWRALLWSVVVGVVLQPVSVDAARPQTRVAATAARDIRTFQLTEEHLRKLELVGRAMERIANRGPDAPPSDVAMFIVLSMSLSFNEPFTDRTVPDTVRTIESGHPELARAIQTAGLTASDYVLTQVTLLLVYPVVAAERRGGQPAPTNDVSAANLAFARAHWDAVDRAMRALSDGAAKYAR